MATENSETKMVTITIPLTRYEKDDVYIAINGRPWLIKRGEPVKVPSYVAENIEMRNRLVAESINSQEALANEARF